MPLLKVSPIIVVEQYVQCPSCIKGRFNISHLLDGKPHEFGTWYCDKCHNGAIGKIKNNEIFIGKSNTIERKKIVFLKYESLLFVVEGSNFQGEIDHETNKYYYEEKTCPTNFLRDVIEIIDLDEMQKDPHGMFYYMGAIPFPEEIKELDEVDIIELYLNQFKK